MKIQTLVKNEKTVKTMNLYKRKQMRLTFNTKTKISKVNKIESNTITCGINRYLSNNSVRELSFSLMNRKIKSLALDNLFCWTLQTKVNSLHSFRQEDITNTTSHLLQILNITKKHSFR